MHVQTPNDDSSAQDCDIVIGEPSASPLSCSYIAYLAHRREFRLTFECESAQAEEQPQLHALNISIASVACWQVACMS